MFLFCRRCHHFQLLQRDAVGNGAIGDILQALLQRIPEHALYLFLLQKKLLCRHITPKNVDIAHLAIPKGSITKDVLGGKLRCPQ